MADDFITMVNRVAVELRRANIISEIKNAINDAITEAAKTRFYFNEMHTSFVTSPTVEYYPDLGLVELDAVWYVQGTTRYNVDIRSQLEMDAEADGNPLNGPQLTDISRYGGKLRLYPIPTTIVTVYLDGYGKLAPSPLVNDADTNAWMTEAELYIRALAKRNVLRDVVRDYGEARVLEGIADDYKSQLVEVTATKMATGRIRSTKF